MCELRACVKGINGLAAIESLRSAGNSFESAMFIFLQQ